MKYIEKKYQQLIEDIKSAYDDTARAYEDTCDTLKYHINELKEQLANKDEEIEKLRRVDKLQAEIDEYNRLGAQHNMNLENEITQLKAKLTEKESDLKAAYGTIEAWETRFYALVKEYGIDLNRPIKKESVVKAKKQVKNDGRGKYERKPFVISCGDCGILFEAKGGNAKYCPECRKARISARTKAWKAKNRSRK